MTESPGHHSPSVGGRAVTVCVCVWGGGGVGATPVEREREREQGQACNGRKGGDGSRVSAVAEKWVAGCALPQSGDGKGQLSGKTNRAQGRRIEHEAAYGDVGKGVGALWQRWRRMGGPGEVSRVRECRTGARRERMDRRAGAKRENYQVCVNTRMSICVSVYSNPCI